MSRSWTAQGEPQEPIALASTHDGNQPLTPAEAPWSWGARVRMVPAIMADETAARYRPEGYSATGVT